MNKLKYFIILLIFLVISSVFNTLNAKSDVYLQKQIKCLSYNIYYEAMNQDREGMYAVGNVTLNRMKSKRFSNSICGVTYDKSKRKNGTYYCEFSWAKPDPKSKYCMHIGSRPSGKIYKDIKDISHNLLTVNMVDNTEGSLFYHADYVNGKWFKKNLHYIKKIGNHLFYK